MSEAKRVRLALAGEPWINPDSHAEQKRNRRKYQNQRKPMNRPNGGVLLPGHEAAARNQQAALAQLRLQIAGSIVGELLPQQLAAQATRARKAEGVFDDEKPVAFNAGDPGGAIDQATSLAIVTADALLAKLGFQENE
jgi:hypothetical protein